MFSVPDIMVVSVLALLLFGPDQLPKMMRQAGRLMREVQSTSQAFVAEMERAADVSDPIHETYRPPAPLVPSMEYAEFPAGEHSDLPPAPEHSDAAAGSRAFGSAAGSRAFGSPAGSRAFGSPAGSRALRICRRLPSIRHGRSGPQHAMTVPSCVPRRAIPGRGE